MWNLNIQHCWQPISFDKVATIRVGDVVAPKPPANKNSIIYTVNNIEADGSLDLLSNPVTFVYAVGNLITGTIIKPEKLVTDNWWYITSK